VFDIFRAKEQRHGSLLGRLRELLNLLALILQFRGVSLFEFFPPAWLMPEPFPQLGAGREFLKPFVDARFLFRKSARPDAVNQHPPAIGIGRFIVNAFEPNAHVPLSQHKLCSVASLG
jgi:hypothetical protein